MFPDLELKGKLKPAHLIALECRSQFGICPAGGRFRAHPQRRHGSEHRPFPPAGLDRGSEFSGFYLPGLQFSFGVYPVHQPDHPDDWKAYTREWLTRNEVGTWCC